MIAIKNVLVATDFGPVSETALAYGRALARTFGGKLHVLHVVEDLTLRFAYADTAIGGLPPEELQAEIVRAAKNRIEAYVSESDRRELNAVPVLRVGNHTANAIAEYAKEAAIDLVVVGTTGRGAIDRALMGSVADKVIRRAPCPVLAVHHPEREFVIPDALQVMSSRA